MQFIGMCVLVRIRLIQLDPLSRSHPALTLCYCPTPTGAAFLLHLSKLVFGEIDPVLVVQHQSEAVYVLLLLL